MSVSFIRDFRKWPLEKLHSFFKKKKKFFLGINIWIGLIDFSEQFQPLNPRPFLQARYVAKLLYHLNWFLSTITSAVLRHTLSPLLFVNLANLWDPLFPLRVGSELIIRLKWGQTEYKGKLESIDSYMNVLLRDTEEFIDGNNTGSLGLVLIRYVCSWVPEALLSDGIFLDIAKSQLQGIFFPFR